MRSSEESHSHSFENAEFRQLFEMKRKKRLLSPRMTTMKAVSKRYDIGISGKRKNVGSLIELCNCKALDNVAYKVHNSSLTLWLDMPAQQRNFNDNNIKAFFICSCFIFCFVFVFAVVGVFVILQSCKIMA